MTIRKFLGPPLMLAALAGSAPAAEPRVAPEVRARWAAGDDAVPVLVALRQWSADPLAAPRVSAPGFVLRRTLSRGVAGTATRAALGVLAGNPDVLAIALDGVVRPAGQAGTAQIGADRLLSLGLDGSGRSVAVVDTGIDTTSPDLGGGPVPNAKVIAGWNVVTGTPDVSDCAGHGTQVAGVVAGPHGVAPGAGIVALKVFGGSLGCDGAHFSDVVAAVEWAVAHRDEFHIEAVNLSLSGNLIRSAFCDLDDPVSAAAFRAARDSGVAVIAAAGNEGTTDGIAWPGCFSDVTAVGMVYSASVGAISWDGAASCQDRTTGADIVPCASNSGTALGLLAPGVHWVTTAAGGAQTQSFSGTSAAAPAASGAVVLARQARPAADPALTLDQLRTTGVPVVDDKNGREAPRIDLGAALDATQAASGPCDGTTIPDALAGGLTCTAEVSSLVTPVSSLSVALSIDHPDPTQLVVTLTGPDGTRVVLMNRSGSAAHAVREVFGRTSSPVEPLSSFAGRDTSGIWKLSVMDTVPGGSGRLVSWALQIEPTAPPATTGAVVRTGVIPTAVHGAGRYGSFFTTDVRLFNSDASSAQSATLRLRSASGVTPDRSVAVTVPPLGTRILSDVVGDAFRTTDYGPLFIDASPALVIGSRTCAGAPVGGRYGLFVPMVSAGSGITAVTPPLALIPAFRGTGFRVNVGLTEMAGASVDAEIIVRDGRGAPKGAVPVHVAPFSMTQVSDVYAAAHAIGSDDDRIGVRVLSGAGRVVPFATAVDNRTNDGSFVGGSVAASELLLPAVANTSGLHDAVFRTDVKLANPGTAPIRVRIQYLPSLGTTASPVVVSLGAGETRLVADALAALFGLVPPAAGALKLDVLDGGRVVATSRTYADSTAGTFGLSFDPGNAGAGAGPGKRLALTFLSGGASTRTNVGFVETSGTAATARLTLYGTDGARRGSRDVSLEGGTAVQWNDVFALMGLASGEGSAIVEILSGGTLAAYSVSVDNRTNDGSLVPATLLP